MRVRRQAKSEWGGDGDEDGGGGGGGDGDVDGDGEPRSRGRCLSCGLRRREEITLIHDLDNLDAAPLVSQRTPSPSGQRVCMCGSVDLAEGGERRPDLRRYRSLAVESRWAGSSFLSPEDAIRDLNRHATDGTEFRWALHISHTDLDLARKSKCSCHSLTPEEKKPHEGAQRGDLRKHHSAETDKWSIKPDYLQTPMHDLRKHSSDDTRMAREARWLQVPEVLPNPKPRCTCPKSKTGPPATPTETKVEPCVDQPPKREVERKLYYSTSLTPDEPPPLIPERPELKKHASEDSRLVKERRKDRPKLERMHARESIASKKWPGKERGSPGEAKKQRAKWAMKTHFSLPAEKRDSKWRGQESTENFKSKSLKERPKYSIRRSLSPDPDPRQLTQLENRIVRRLISPDITVTDAKWAPYEDTSPLPTIGVKKPREPKHISEIKWTPYEGSASPSTTRAGSFAITEPDGPPETWSPFHNVTPTHNPPPMATPPTAEQPDEDFRWRILNQVSAFPLYQGGWKDESPERTPPKQLEPVDLSTPVWSPQVKTSPMTRQRSQIRYSPQPSESPPSPPPPPSLHRKSISKSRGFSKRKESRARSMSGQSEEERRLIPPTLIVRAASEESKRQRPQLLRSKALLQVPTTLANTKRSLSEEVPRGRERARGPFRARSEESSKRHDDPWFSQSDYTPVKTPELREYVTTV